MLDEDAQLEFVLTGSGGGGIGGFGIVGEGGDVVRNSGVVDSIGDGCCVEDCIGSGGEGIGFRIIVRAAELVPDADGSSFRERSTELFRRLDSCIDDRRAAVTVFLTDATAGGTRFVGDNGAGASLEVRFGRGDAPAFPGLDARGEEGGIERRDWRRATPLLLLAVLWWPTGCRFTIGGVR